MTNAQLTTVLLQCFTLGAFLVLMIFMLIAWLANMFYKRPVINGASVFNWCSLILLALAVLARNSDLAGTLGGVFFLPWLVAVPFSRSFKKKANAKASGETPPQP